MNDIPGDWGTAVNVQTMVFGNKGETSGTGVAYTQPIHRRKRHLRRVPDQCTGRGRGGRCPHTAEGILTVRGGMTSHAAVVARGMGTCCVSGCGEIKIDEDTKKFELGGHTFAEGDYISLDGSPGKIYKGDIETQEASVSGVPIARLAAAQAALNNR